MDWIPIYLSLKLAFTTTALLLVVGVPLAFFLATTQFKGKFFIESLVALPLVLPPTVIGFYLLLLFSESNPVGAFFSNYIGIPLLFSFEGLVAGSLLYSLPFMVQPIQAGIEQLPNSYFEAARILGKNKKEVLIKIALPNSKKALLTAIVLTFAHTLGEFGIVLMIGGKIEGVTKVASVAIYDEVEAMQYQSAHLYSIAMLLVSMIVLSVAYYVNRK